MNRIPSTLTMILKKIAQGAEATVFADYKSKKEVKKRIPKTYRLPALDNTLRQSRTKREATVLAKLRLAQIPCPDIISSSESTLEMAYIPGKRLRDVLTKKNYAGYCKELGKLVRLIHKQHIIHGDLTTSNFVVHEKENKIYVVDFGLSFFSHKIEDKAVDIHLLRQALESKHYQFWEPAFKIFLKSYNDSEVAKRLEQVEQRGRNKERY